MSGTRKQDRLWSIESAQARFLDLARSARVGGPQLVTVDEKDAVFVLSAEDFAAVNRAGDNRGRRVLAKIRKLLTPQKR